MKKLRTNTLVKLLSLTLALAMLASLPVLAAPGGITKPIQPVDANSGGILSSGIMYEDEYVKVEYFEEATEAQGNNVMSGMATTGSVSMSLGNTSSIVAELSAYINVTLTGQSIPNGTAVVYLDVNGQRVAETPIVNNAARMHIAEAPAAGTYNIVAWGQDGFIAQAPLEVTEYDLGIWNAIIGTNADGKTVANFIEPITIKDGTLSGKVTLNGTAVSASLGSDNMSIIINYPYTSLKEGDKIIMSGIKYPRLFPSFSFTFTLLYSENVRYPLTVETGRVYYMSVTGFEKMNIRKGEYTVKYDTAKLELLDAAAQSPEALLNGTAPGAGINVKSHANGVLVFTSTRPEEDFSGVLTLLKFRAKASGDTTVTLR